jgi:hypothetical protein
MGKRLGLLAVLIGLVATAGPRGQDQPHASAARGRAGRAPVQVSDPQRMSYLQDAVMDLLSSRLESHGGIRWSRSISCARR